MICKILKAGHLALAALASVALVLALTASGAMAQQRVREGMKYIPTIWVDPDGCEHWVMDDGAEGYMDIHLDRNGKPVCHRGNTCGVMPTDQLFATDKYVVSPAGRQRLMQFFQQNKAVSFVITGHTDSRASDAYNMTLSYNRANAVARIAKQSGARVSDVRGYGERMPKASNSTAAGMQANRRVEIICIR